MSELISGKEALESILNGIDVQYLNPFNQWDDSAIAISVMDFLDCKFKFRLKPRTITINGIEVPAPAGDKDYHHQGIWILNSLEPKEYGYVVLDITDELPRYWWRTEEEIKQVVADLRQVFGGSHDN